MPLDSTDFPSLPGADLIIRSSDDADFPVHRAVIGLASPIFKDMFDIPQPLHIAIDTGLPDGLPVVQVTEKQKTFRYLLLFYYSLVIDDTFEEWERLEEAVEILEAALKYEMNALVRHTCSRLLQVAAATPEFTIRVFAIACRFKLEDMARRSAKLTLNHENKLLWRDTEEHGYMTNHAFTSLLLYHEACVAKAKETSTRLEWLDENETFTRRRSHKYVWFRCEHRACRSEQYGLPCASSWWQDYVRRTREELSRVPSSAKIGTPDAIALALSQAASCIACKGDAYKDLLRFNDLFKKQLNMVISEVSGSPDLPRAMLLQ